MEKVAKSTLSRAGSDKENEVPFDLITKDPMSVRFLKLIAATLDDEELSVPPKYVTLSTEKSPV